MFAASNNHHLFSRRAHASAEKTTVSGDVAQIGQDSKRPINASTNVPASGLWALAVVAAHYRIAADPEMIAHELGLTGSSCASEDIIRGARRIGLKSKALTNQSDRCLDRIPLPAILRDKNNEYIILASRLSEGQFRIIVPGAGARVVERADLTAFWAKEVILLQRRLGGDGVSPATFNYRWFLSSIWRYRRPISHALGASLFIQLFALITPLFFQVIIDKVLPYKSESTLIVIVTGLVLLGTFDVVLQYLRAYVLNHTTSRIDVELGARLFNHLLRLPLSYFETRPTGQTVARVRELETIRSFLTGQGLSSVIDLLFTIVFVTVLFLHSPTLTAIVLASIPFYVIVSLLLRPILKQRIEGIRLLCRSQRNLRL